MSKFPYPGLRPFGREEADIFFGREEHVDQLLEKLDKTRFVAVFGPSGFGKSSLVRAGLFSALETGFLVNAGANWRIIEMRPGYQPYSRLADALIRGFGSEDRANFTPQQKEEITEYNFEAILKRGPLGLKDVLDEFPLPEETNLLLLVDQFEEIFRYHREGERDETTAFVNLILESTKQLKWPIYVVITMRSDFLSDCTLFLDLPEAINEGQFLTPRLTRDQFQRAIQKPAQTFKGEVEFGLVNRLLNEAGTHPDQLPLMQHVLMRMWTLEPKSTSLEEGKVLTLDHYEKVGGFKEVLSQHADEALNDFTDHQKVLVERLFRALCERGTDQRDTRHPMQFGRLCEILGTSKEVLTSIIEPFRTPERSFITPPRPHLLEPNTVIDISHESLIRQWKTLRIWVEKEANSAEIFLRLRDAANRWHQQTGALWSSPDLDIAMDWEKKEEPNSDWAERYGGDFDLTVRFLDESKAHKEAQIKARQKAHYQEQELMRIRRERIFVLTALTGFFLLCTWAGWERYKAIKAKNEAQMAFGITKKSQEAALEAQSRLEIALAKAKNSKRNAEGARREAERARDQLEVALKNERVAKDNAQKAQKEAEQARKKLEVAYLDSKKARNEAVLARDKLQIALDEEKKAKQEKEEARKAAVLAEGKANKEKEKQKELKEAYELTAQALREADKINPTKALLLAGSAWEKEKSEIINESIYKIYRENEFYLYSYEFDTKILATIFDTGWNILLTGSPNGHVNLLDLNNSTMCYFEGHRQQVRTLAFSPNKKFFLTGSDDHSARLWDKEGNFIREFIGHSGPVQIVGFAPDGQTFITGSNDKTLRLWSIEGKYLKPFHGHQGPINSIAFSPDGHSVASGSDDGTLRLWNHNGELIHIFRFHQGPINSVVFLPDGKHILSGSTDKTAILWHHSGRKIAQYRGHDGPVQAVAYSPNTQVVYTGSSDKTIRLWDIQGNNFNTITCHQKPISTINFILEDKSIVPVTASVDGITRVWRIKEDLIQTLEAHDNPISSVSINSTGELMLSASRDRTVKLWKLKGTQFVESATYNFEFSVREVVFTPDNKSFLAALYKGPPQLINLNKRSLKKFKGHLYSVRCLDISSDGKMILTGSDDNTVRLWNQEGKLLKKFKGHTGSILSVEFSPISKSFITGSEDSTLQFWDVSAEQNIQGVIVPGDAVLTVRFSPDGQFILTGSRDGTVRFWSSSGELTSTQLKHHIPVRAVVYSPDGQFILTGADDAIIRLWDRKGQLLRIYHGHQGPIRTIQFAPDGKTFVSGSDDKTIRIWKTAPDLDEFLEHGPLAKLTDNRKRNFDVHNH